MADRQRDCTVHIRVEAVVFDEILQMPEDDLRNARAVRGRRMS